MEKINDDTPIDTDIKKENNFFEETYKAEYCKVAYQHELVVLPSFHRCGNTLTRELLEGITNILTGSDDLHIFPGSEGTLKPLANNNPGKIENFAADEGGCVLRRLPDCLHRHAVAVCRASRDIGTLGPQPKKRDDGLVRRGAFAGADGFGLNRAFRPGEYSSAQESG